MCWTRFFAVRVNPPTKQRPPAYRRAPGRAGGIIRLLLGRGGPGPGDAARGGAGGGAALRFVVSCVYAVGGAYTQKPVYTRGGTYTHPLCIRTTARVNVSSRVYAPGCVYAPAA